MLKKAQISNYQAHKDSTLEFSSGLNVITGKSCSGKSSIIRAIRLCLLNTPKGDSFRPFGIDKKETTKVHLSFDDGEVIRERNGVSVNHYLDGNGTEYKALKPFPSEISDITRMDDLNIQVQAQQWFMISDKPGDIAKAFNKVADLDRMDVILKSINSKVLRSTSMIKFLEGELASTEERVAEFSWTEEADFDLSYIETETSKFNALIDEEEKLSGMINHITEVQEKLDKYSSLEEAGKKLSGMDGTVAEWDYHNNEFNHLSGILKTVDSLALKLKSYTDIDSALNALKSYKAQAVDNDKLISEYNDLLDIINNIEQVETELLSVGKIITGAEVQLSKFKTCPLCGGKI